MNATKLTIEDVDAFLAKNREECKKHKRERLEREAKAMSEGLAHQTPLLHTQPTNP